MEDKVIRSVQATQICLYYRDHIFANTTLKKLHILNDC